MLERMFGVYYLLVLTLACHSCGCSCFCLASSGKTTSVHALARELLGPAYKDACLELNASDARGIDVVRNRIKSFAQNKVTLPPGR